MDTLQPCNNGIGQQCHRGAGQQKIKAAFVPRIQGRKFRAEIEGKNIADVNAWP
jgi:hypothetical protein